MSLCKETDIKSRTWIKRFRIPGRSKSVNPNLSSECGIREDTGLTYDVIFFLIKVVKDMLYHKTFLFPYRLVTSSVVFDWNCNCLDV